MSNATEQIMAQVQTAIVDGMPAALAPLQQAIQARVGIPVERRDGRVIRSKPGEPPRRDTGRLQAEVNVGAAEASSAVSGTISADVPYAERLNDEMDRPIAGDEPEKHMDGIADALADSITASNS